MTDTENEGRQVNADPGCLDEDEGYDGPEPPGSPTVDGDSEGNLTEPGDIDGMDAPLLEPEPMIQPGPASVEAGIDELKTSMLFIRALQSASLNGGGLGEEAVERIRNPPEGVLAIDNEDDIFSLKQFLSSQGSSQAQYTAWRNNYNARHENTPMLAYERIRAKVAEWSGVHPVIHDMCPNSCIAYTGPFADLERCPYANCGLSRWDTFQLENSRGKIKIPAQHYYYTIPLAPQIQSLWRSPKTSAHLNYRRERTTEILQELEDNNGVLNSYDDVFHGREYIDAVRRGDIAKNDTVVMFAIDGAQLYRDKFSDCWIYIWVILDLDPKVRYKKDFVMPGGFIPGPHKPKHMESFLFPGFHHVAAIQREGLRVWDALDRSFKNSNIFFYIGELCVDSLCLELI